MKAADFTLTDDERVVLDALWEETRSTGALVDAVSFRADHEEFIALLGRLNWLRYLNRVGETYGLTPLGLTEIDDPECRRVLEIGARLLDLLRKRYKDRQLRKQPLYVRDVATEFGVERPFLDFALMVLHDALSLACGGWSSDLRSTDAYVLPSESVFNYKTFGDIVGTFVGWRDQALANPVGLVGLQPLSFTPPSDPKALSSELRMALPERFHRLMSEIETAHAGKLPCLTMMGLRAVLDLFLNECVGDSGNFSDKISLMAKRSLLNSNQVEILKSAVEMGHAAAHRMHVPTPEQCNQVLHIVEHLLREKYVLHETARRLREETPVREKLTPQ